MKRVLLILLTIGLLAGCANKDQSGTELRNAEAAALYETAKRALDRGDWQTATTEYEALQAQYPFGNYATQAQLDIIYVYYRANDVASAVAAAERFRRINPRHPSVPYSWYMQGLALEEKNEDTLKRWVGVDTTLRDPVPRRQAFDAYTTVVERFPESDYASDARERLAVLFNEGARYQLSVAQFYADRSAWVAAAQRAITVIDEFAGTPSVEPAMDLLESAYQALGLTDLANGVASARQAGVSAERPAGIPDMPALYEGERVEVPPAPESSQPPSGPSGTTPGGDMMGM
ncbi:MAG: outer membrane protein assembly factor BamD [Spiribacter sp.]|nr:outer membrane protein assembly factor BamD [Spiribacter sp.]